jgi:hypothetical protein
MGNERKEALDGVRGALLERISIDDCLGKRIVAL